MAKSKRFIMSVPGSVKRVIERVSKLKGCSQAEVVKASLYETLRVFFAEDAKNGKILR